jgi:hypothetical protein
MDLQDGSTVHFLSLKAITAYMILSNKLKLNTNRICQNEYDSATVVLLRCTQDDVQFR